MAATVLDEEISRAVSSSITRGTIPESEVVLTSSLTSRTLISILEEVSVARQQLENEICQTSKEAAADIDGWIARARKIQEEIAQSRATARDVVKGFEAAKSLAKSTKDAKAKIDLLENEIKFNTQVSGALDDLRSLYGEINAIQSTLMRGDILASAKRWAKLDGRIRDLADNNAKYIIADQSRKLHGITLQHLERALKQCFVFGQDGSKSWLHLKHEVLSNPETTGETDNPTRANPLHITIDNLLEAYSDLQALENIVRLIAKSIDSIILRPVTSLDPRERSFTTKAEENRLEVTSLPGRKIVSNVLDCTRDIVTFLSLHLPAAVKVSVAGLLVPELASSLVTDWLTPCVPLEILDFEAFVNIQKEVSGLANLISETGWPGGDRLQSWLEMVPRMWLAKRRMASLDGVRKAFASTRGPSRQVERVERQTIFDDVAAFAPSGEVDEWDQGWADEKDAGGAEAGSQDNDGDGWNFDDDVPEAGDAQVPENNKDSKEEGEDAADAWGWDEDTSSPAIEKVTAMGSSKVPLKGAAVNGSRDTEPSGREITLRETYAITDIPDYVLQIIVKDIQDSSELSKNPSIALKSVSPSLGLLALPTFVLAMFRAISPSYYTPSIANGNMHLYNDSLYIAEKLRDISKSPELSKLLTDCDTLEKFGKGSYAREMDIQRTILNDLLDGAQGFANCTKAPYWNQCEEAISSVVDRLRLVYEEWKPILSHSALLQSIGSLLSKVIDKMIDNIEDLEDITEPESQHLANFCNELSSLSDLFLPQSAGREETESVPMTAVYVSSWLRFQYMANILESSLVDIKYLWTEGELSLEFSVEEVVDLTRALFADSPSRRSAIAEIQRARGDK